MSGFATFVELGFRHITDPRGLDHVLFLLALAAVYRVRDWRGSLWVITAFTLGHSLTLALAVTGTLGLPTALIELLIPLTIVLTAAENLVPLRAGSGVPWHRRYRPVFAGAFGLVHGAGFANYLRSLFVDDIVVPLLGFNLGLEAGQIVVLLLAALVFTVLDRALELAATRSVLPVRARALMVSSVVLFFAGRMLLQRAPW